MPMEALLIKCAGVFSLTPQTIQYVQLLNCDVTDVKSGVAAQTMDKYLDF